MSKIPRGSFTPAILPLMGLLKALLVLALMIGSQVWGYYMESAEIFDFIVVGGGTAGCVVASRLSENPKYTVLLLEAGQIPDPGMDVPALSPNISIATNAIKVFRTVPQKNIGGNTNGVKRYLVGSTLGGSSSVNMMIWNRGSPNDYDNWARITGDHSWNYSNMLKYFIRVEDYKGGYSSEQHGIGGPITVSKPKYSPGEQYWFEAGKYLGYPTNVDQNGPQQISFTNVEYSKKFGRRVSSYSAYIKPILGKRSNLKVIMGAHVIRLLFEGNRATGVIYRSSSGMINYVHARREIVLSAGVIGSPSILLRSGIGPKEVLDDCKIFPVKILPVGLNLHDHVGIKMEIIVSNKSGVRDEARDLNSETWNIYNLHGDGPYSMYGANLQAFVKTPSTTVKNNLERHENNDYWANLQPFLMFGRAYNRFNNYRQDFHMKKDEALAVYVPYLTRPKSRGSLRLNSSNIEGDPLIDFQYLSHPQDVEDLLYGIKLGLHIIEKTPAFQNIGARYPSNPVEPCKHLKFRSDEYFRCYIKHVAGIGAHAAGTCRMGNVYDPNAVVDSSLKVIGIHNVRVADTSIMPDVVNANTQVGAYVIGEKAADLILNANSKR